MEQWINDQILQQRPIAAHQLATNDLDWWIARLDESIVKLLKRKLRAHFATVVFAQL